MGNCWAGLLQKEIFGNADFKTWFYLVSKSKSKLKVSHKFTSSCKIFSPKVFLSKKSALHPTILNSQFFALFLSFTSPLFLIFVFFLPLLASNEAIRVQYSTASTRYCPFLHLNGNETSNCQLYYFFFLHLQPYLMRKSENHVRWNCWQEKTISWVLKLP